MTPLRHRPDRFLHLVLGTLCLARSARRDERGLSQSTEQAIMIAGAVTVAIIIVAFVTGYVNDALSKAGT